MEYARHFCECVLCVISRVQWYNGVSGVAGAMEAQTWGISLYTLELPDHAIPQTKPPAPHLPQRPRKAKALLVVAQQLGRTE